jgi:hypothetical protein
VRSADAVNGRRVPKPSKTGTIKMRKLESYIKKYGPIDGPKMFRRLQREAALASGHARHKKAIAKRPKA